MIRTRYFTFTRRPSDSGPYHILKVNIADRHELQVSVSPAGRNVRVWFDGVQLDTPN